MSDHIDFELTESWQTRAKECRADAQRLNSADARHRMLTAAEDFERMASEARNNQPQHWVRM